MPEGLITQQGAPTHEVRSFTLTELRVAEGDANTPPVIEGYAAVFNVMSDDLGGFRELIHPGAFIKTIGEADVRALINHDPSLVIGRTKNSTLELREDIHGLRVKILPPDTSYARDLVASLKRGDIDQMSFAFEAVRDEWRIVNDGNGEDTITRSLIEVKLYDVSPVTYPAYPQTSVMVRSKVTELKQNQDARNAPPVPGQAAHPEAEQNYEQALEAMRMQLELEELE